MWKECKDKNNHCNLPKEKTIICYGSNNEYNCRTYKGGGIVDCTNEFFFYNKSDKATSCWIKPYKKHLFPTKLNTQPFDIIGNTTDFHGCKLSAGYTWCEDKKTCLRSWITPCNNHTSIPTKSCTNKFK